jgi:hypothetical protein
MVDCLPAAKVSSLLLKMLRSCTVGENRQYYLFSVHNTKLGLSLSRTGLTSTATMNLIATNRFRVQEKTNPAVNARLRAELRKRYEYFNSHRDEIGQRLEELDREWDVERMLELNSSVVALVALLMGYRLFPMIVIGFLLWHAIQGWCPPLTVFRYFGSRTLSEIQDERYALMAMRGDFGVDPTNPDHIFEKSMMAAGPQS